MSVYLDTSVLVALFTDDPFSSRADLFLKSRSNVLVVGDFAATEFASSIARHVRMQELTLAEARTVFGNFDAWVMKATMRVEMASSDVRMAEVFLRRLDLTLRAGDALNLAIIQRIGAELATFDVKMAECARALGTPVVAL